MWEKLWWLPEWIVDETVWGNSDKITEQLYSDEWLQQSRDFLDSTLLSEKMRYYNQLWTINWVLKEVFWDWYKFIILRNRFLSIIDELMQSYHKLSNWDWTEENYLFMRDMLSSYLTKNWWEFFDRLKEQNEWLWYKELSELRVWYKNRFVDLLLERLTYITE